LAETPLRLHLSGVKLAPEAEKRKRALLGRRLARFGTFIERADVRFAGIDSPFRGGEDVRCRINLAVSGRPSVFVEERARDANRAFALAAASITRAMARSVERKGLSMPQPTNPPSKKPRVAARRRANATEPVSKPRARRTRRGKAYVLEEFSTRPSRKSTRKSANRLKGGSKLMRRTQRRKHSAKARASRARVQRQQSRVR
jgi:hypothetical protein